VKLGLKTKEEEEEENEEKLKEEVFCFFA